MATAMRHWLWLQQQSHAHKIKVNVKILTFKGQWQCLLRNTKSACLKHSNETKTNALSFCNKPKFLLWLSRWCTAYTSPPPPPPQNCRPNDLIWFKCVYLSHTHTHNNIQFNFIVANFCQSEYAGTRTYEWIDFEIHIPSNVVKVNLKYLFIFKQSFSSRHKLKSKI